MDIYHRNTYRDCNVLYLIILMVHFTACYQQCRRMYVPIFLFTVGFSKRISIEQCFAANIIQCFQQYCSALLSLN